MEFVIDCMLEIPGKPDISNKKIKFVIFINGCFWHKHDGCNNFVLPKTRTKWWLEKINNNVKKDKNNVKILKQNGWKVFTLKKQSVSQIT